VFPALCAPGCAENSSLTGSCGMSSDAVKLTFCVKRDLYVPSGNHSRPSGELFLLGGTNVQRGMEGLDDGRYWVKQDARPEASNARPCDLSHSLQCAVCRWVIWNELDRIRCPYRTTGGARIHAWRRAPHRPRNGDGPMEMRVLDCHEQRMLRALHGRWPYRRSHCRHDLHWLVRVQAHQCWCASVRTHSMSGLRVHSRRP
jgi:hypothetical protein